MEVIVELYSQANPRPGVSYRDLLYVFFIADPFFLFLDIKGFHFDSATAPL